VSDADGVVGVAGGDHGADHVVGDGGGFLDADALVPFLAVLVEHAAGFGGAGFLVVGHPGADGGHGDADGVGGAAVVDEVGDVLDVGGGGAGPVDAALAFAPAAEEVALVVVGAGGVAWAALVLESFGCAFADVEVAFGVGGLVGFGGQRVAGGGEVVVDECGVDHLGGLGHCCSSGSPPSTMRRRRCAWNVSPGVGQSSAQIPYFGGSQPRR